MNVGRNISVDKKVDGGMEYFSKPPSDGKIIPMCGGGGEW